MLTLAECPNDQFFKAVNTLFETAPLLADQLEQNRPYNSYSDLIDKAKSLVANMHEKDRIAVVNAHPRIGAPVATLSALSLQEQGDTSANVSEKLEILNKEYETQFGFKFVIFVNGRPKSEIVTVLQARLKNAGSEELETGLQAMMLIAHDRLRKLGQE